MLRHSKRHRGEGRPIELVSKGSRACRDVVPFPTKIGGTGNLALVGCSGGPVGLSSPQKLAPERLCYVQQLKRVTAQSVNSASCCQRDYRRGMSASEEWKERLDKKWEMLLGCSISWAQLAQRCQVQLDEKIDWDDWRKGSTYKRVFETLSVEGRCSGACRDLFSTERFKKLTNGVFPAHYHCLNNDGTVRKKSRPKELTSPDLLQMARHQGCLYRYRVLATSLQGARSRSGVLAPRACLQSQQEPPQCAGDHRRRHTVRVPTLTCTGRGHSLSG